MHIRPWIARLFHTHFGSRDTIYWFRRWKDSKFTLVHEYAIYMYVPIRGIYITCSSLRNSIDFVIFPSRMTRLVPVPPPLLRSFSTSIDPFHAGGDTEKCMISTIYLVVLWNVRFLRVDLKVSDLERAAEVTNN